VGTGLLTAVQDLWRRHSDTLGFLPAGAFEEYARNRQVLAGVDGTGALIGYTIYRVTGRRASIAHLCVSPAARGTGVSRHLFNAIKTRVADCDDIVARCRRDYPASAIWPRLGFLAAGEACGKGSDGTTLTIWRYDIQHLPLLAACTKRGGNTLRVVIDANVFFDLDHESDAIHSDSRALTADWLSEFIELSVTVELYNEINRRDSSHDRARQRQRLQQFHVVDSNNSAELRVRNDLEASFPHWNSESGTSDIRQLSRTISGEVSLFVTRDSRVRQQADLFYERYGLSVVNPFELILRFDELRRDEDYRPKRFITAGLAIEKPRSAEDLAKIADILYEDQPSLGSRRRTLAILRELVAEPDRFDVHCIRASDGAFLAAYAIDRPAPEILRLPLFAVADSHLGRTAAHHFSEKLSMLAASERRSIVVVESAIGERIEEALADAGFSSDNEQWIKLALPFVGTASTLATHLAAIEVQIASVNTLAQRAANILRELRSSPRSSPKADASLVEVERALWPAKIADAEIPCFIVPIRPNWAAQLFDVELAMQELFGADPHLAMNSQNAYYRAAQPEVLTTPARILWYVSHDPAFQGTKAVRGCSYVDEIVVAPPKDAFRRFRRLGVYSWNDVLGVAGHELDKNIMAFRFSKTESFSQPITWTTLQSILATHGGRSQVQSPVKISEGCFLDLYQRGIRP
jgi:GNAT superfamily N-acetyltransferase